jgi:hypothetical protein
MISLGPRQTLRVLALVTVAIGLGAVQAGASPKASAGKPLVGTFKLTKGTFANGVASGSYFRMVYPGGTIKGGKFFQNPDSTASDKSYTLVRPGSSGGLSTAGFQAGPTPAFDAKGDALATKIIAPARFNAIAFGLSTLSRDPKGGPAIPAPSIVVTNGKLSGQVEAVYASWNKLFFNQGSPKPGGAKPGLTSSVSGTYNSKTGAFALQWTSAVVGGPFNGFTGYWHLQGTFSPSS